MPVSYLLLLSFFHIVTGYTETCIAVCTTATLLDFFGYRLYNASVIAANPTATTYLLACTPQYSGDCNNDGTTVNLTAINGPSTAGLIGIDTRKSASWEYQCPVTDFKISSCTYIISSILPSGSVISGEFHSSGAFSTLTGPTVLSDSTVRSEGFTEITNVVLLVTGGVEKLATLTEPASMPATTSGVGSSGNSSVTTGVPSVPSTQTTTASTGSQSAAAKSVTSSSSQGIGGTAAVGNGAMFGGLVGMFIAAF